MNANRDSASSKPSTLKKTGRLSRSLLGAIALSAVLVPTAFRAADAQPHFASPEHAPLPLMDTQGGTILAQPKVVPIFFAADPLAPELAAYFQKLGASTYLAQSLGEYGVGAVTVAAPIVQTATPPASVLDIDLATWMASQIDLGALPPEDGSTVYQLVLPATTQVNQGGIYGESYPSCAPFTFEAYPSSSGPAPMTVVPGCAPPFAAGLSAIDVVTVGSSAILADAFTAPFSNEAPAYVSTSWHGSGWGWWTGAGVGLLCLGVPSDATSVPKDLGLRVANLWSNRAARRGGDPCGTTKTERAYFNAAPAIVGGVIPAPYAAAKGVLVPASGGAVTIPVDLFSEGPTEAWSLSAVERTDLDLQPAPVLSFAFDEPRGRGGDRRHLTITRAAPAPGSAPEYALVFEITSTLRGVSHGWLVTVGSD